ncbi:MAG TPA: alpha/beta hydrolase [Caulobacteraceae bacterium]|nr:alpha/beta hydrolase [Caulobacteraceae bacterium]
MPFAQLSKVRLEYFTHGQGPERVVFIHGFQASATIWRMVQEALPSDRYTSIAINNRGAGASEAPLEEDDFGCEAFADDAFELVSQLGWKDFTLVGHSMGGATVAALAVKHPGVLKGLVLLDPADPDGRMRDAPASELETAIDRAVSALIARRDSVQPGDGVDARGAGAPPELMRQLDAEIRAAPERRLRGSMRSMMTLRLGDRVKSLPMPVLLAGGDADELIPVSNMLATWAKYPAGTGLCFWHGVGHSPNLDCPSDLATVLRKFIEITIPARAKANAA